MKISGYEKKSLYSKSSCENSGLVRLGHTIIILRKGSSIWETGQLMYV